MILDVFWRNTFRLKFRKFQSMRALHVLTVTAARDMEDVLIVTTRHLIRSIAGLRSL